MATFVQKETMYLQKLAQTKDNLPAAIIRIILGLVLFPHGAQKVFGWFGGYGFSATMNYFTQTAKLPALIAFLVILIEFLGSLLLIIGIGTRVAATSVTILFICILFFAHASTGFFMDWAGTNPAPGMEGFEYHLLLLGMSISLILSGGGRYSLDRYFTIKN